MTAPRTRGELFDAIRALMNHGWYDLPSTYGGTGGPGRYLENLLELTAGSKDVPDSEAGWELKWYTKRTHLITLLHKSPDGPQHIMRYLVRMHGWKD